MKKVIVCLMMVMAMCSISVCSFATSNLTDVEGHWGATSIQRWEKEGVITLSGEYLPDGTSSRGEFAVKISNLLQLEAKANMKKFTDISKDSPYYDALAKVVYAGLIEGYGDGKIDPDGEMSREQYIVILNRMLKTPAADLKVLEAFTDADDVSDWAKPAMASFVANGYMNGYPDKTLRAGRSISRAEVDKLLDFSVSLVARRSGTYDLANTQGSVIVLAKNVSLVNASENDNICVLSSVATRNLKVNGERLKDAPAILEEEESSGSGSGSGSGGGSTVTIGTLTITNNGTTYDTEASSNIATADQITVKVDGASYSLNSSNYATVIVDIFNAMTENDAEILAAITTIDASYSSNAHVRSLGLATIYGLEEAYRTAAVNEFLATADISDVYDFLISEGCTPSAIKVSAANAIPSVLPEYADVVSFLASL